MTAKTASYIAFSEVYPDKPRLTRIWNVITIDGAATILGTVQWFGRWRCNGFFPQPNTIYAKKCLRDIADFCDDHTRDHRVGER